MNVERQLSRWLVLGGLAIEARVLADMESDRVCVAMREYPLLVHDSVERVSIMMRQRETPLGVLCGNAQRNSFAMQWL
jgi:hypothetical protein